MKGDGLYEKANITGIVVIACVALCAIVRPWSTKVGDLSAKPVNTAVIAETEARSEEMSQILLSGDSPAPEVEIAAENEPPKTEITAEEKAESEPPAEPTSRTVSKSASTTTEPKPGTIAVIDGNRCMCVPGFGWVKDEGGGSQGTMVGSPGDELTGNKVGQMGGATVGSDGDINKQIGIMGGGTVAEDMYENGHKIGIMGSDGAASSSTQPPAYTEPEITGDVIYAPLQPPVRKDSTPPAYKPNGEPYNP